MTLSKWQEYLAKCFLPTLIHIHYRESFFCIHIRELKLADVDEAIIQTAQEPWALLYSGQSRAMVAQFTNGGTLVTPQQAGLHWPTDTVWPTEYRIGLGKVQRACVCALPHTELATALHATQERGIQIII